jgi:hypothetical protein
MCQVQWQGQRSNESLLIYCEDEQRVEARNGLCKSPYLQITSNTMKVNINLCVMNQAHQISLFP